MIRKVPRWKGTARQDSFSVPVSNVSLGKDFVRCFSPGRAEGSSPGSGLDPSGFDFSRRISGGCFFGGDVLGVADDSFFEDGGFLFCFASNGSDVGFFD